jgi:hypothetical protein
MEEILSQEEVAHESAPEPTTETTTETGNKRKRGERGLNQFPKVTYRVTDVSATGQPLAPAETLPKWRNTLGFLVRDHLDITVREWKNVDNNEITRMWNRLLTRFVLPQGSEDLVKEHTLKQWGIMFRNYKSELNSKWAKKGLDPTKRYKITAGQWAVFLEQRNSDEFKALSESKSELAKRNKYHHHLGTVVTSASLPNGSKRMKRRGLRVCRRSLTNLVAGARGGFVLGYRQRKPILACHLLTQWSKRLRRIFSRWQLSRKQANLSHKGRRMFLLLLWVTQSIPVVYEVSHPRKDGKKDSDQSGKECIENAIATRKNCLIFLRRRLRKKSNR